MIWREDTSIQQPEKRSGNRRRGIRKWRQAPYRASSESGVSSAFSVCSVSSVSSVCGVSSVSSVCSVRSVCSVCSVYSVCSVSSVPSVSSVSSVCIHVSKATVLSCY